jgi:hypothetical protein
VACVCACQLPRLRWGRGNVGRGAELCADYCANARCSRQLITWLPAFMHMPTVIKPPDEVHVALEVLPKIKEYLARAMNQPPRKGGPKPNVERQLCAAIVVEAWTLIHGKAQPRSDWLYRACNAYWQACGHEYRSEGWRRDVEDAINNPLEWVRDVLIRHKTQARL